MTRQDGGAVLECDDACEEHRGPVRPIWVQKWGAFNYCEEAIAEDERRGLVVEVARNQGEGQ